MSLKVCIDPHCEAVWHNCPSGYKVATHCLDCDGNLIKINEETYRKKYAGNFFQYDYPTHTLIPADQRGRSVQGDVFGQ